MDKIGGLLLLFLLFYLSLFFCSLRLYEHGKEQGTEFTSRVVSLFWLSLSQHKGPVYTSIILNPGNFFVGFRGRPSLKSE